MAQQSSASWSPIVNRRATNDRAATLDGTSTTNMQGTLPRRGFLLSRDKEKRAGSVAGTQVTINKRLPPIPPASKEAPIPSATPSNTNAGGVTFAPIPRPTLRSDGQGGFAHMQRREHQSAGPAVNRTISRDRYGGDDMNTLLATRDRYQREVDAALEVLAAKTREGIGLRITLDDIKVHHKADRESARLSLQPPPTTDPDILAQMEQNEGRIREQEAHIIKLQQQLALGKETALLVNSKTELLKRKETELLSLATNVRETISNLKDYDQTIAANAEELRKARALLAGIVAGF